MASVKAEIFKEENLNIKHIETTINYNNKTIIYFFMALTTLLFFRKLIVKFCRQHDRSYEAKYE